MSALLDGEVDRGGDRGPGKIKCGRIGADLVPGRCRLRQFPTGYPGLADLEAPGQLGLAESGGGPQIRQRSRDLTIGSVQIRDSQPQSLTNAAKASRRWTHSAGFPGIDDRLVGSDAAGEIGLCQTGRRSRGPEFCRVELSGRVLRQSALLADALSKVVDSDSG